jgi:hypothetical protein
VLAKKCGLWPSAWHNNIDDHGSSQGDRLTILAWRRHPVALSEALSMVHGVTCTASSQVATWSSKQIKTTIKILF